jgi:tetratricopeptide (TPR) repeat protein
VWGDSLALWQDNAKKSPNKGIVLVSLAAEYLKRNMPEKALPLFVRGLEIDMNLNFRPKIGIGRSLTALNIYRSRFTTGEEYIQAGGTYNSGAFDYGNSSKWNGVINNNMGLAYEYLMEPEKALTAYKTALTLNPAYDLAWYNLALLTSKRGDTVLSAEAIARLKLLNPSMAKALESALHH